MNGNKTRIIVTDSGLGGLNIAANIYESAKKTPLKNDLEIIFFNSLPKENFGYNSMTDVALKSKIFNNALLGMSKLEPDLILIACNTLSVVYYSTEYYKNPRHEVKGIIELGVNLALDSIKSPLDKLIVLGTPTTITGNSHKNLLIEKGFNQENIITKACKNLESEIQINSYSDKVKSLIEEYIREAVPNPLPDVKYFVLLGCTHYEYSNKIFRDVLSSYFNNYEILNPNSVMVEEAIKSLKGADLGRMVSGRIISRTAINIKDLKNISDILKKKSRDFGMLLLDYEYNPDSFSVSELQ